MSEQTYTVFCDEVGGEPGTWDGYEGEALHTLIEDCASADHAELIPVAWIAGEVGDDDEQALRAASIAAGRTIELVGDRYIARGVEQEKPEYTPEQLAWILWGKRQMANTAEPKHPRLTWADPKPCTRWDGFTVTRSTQEQDAPRSLSPDLRPTGHQIEPTFGSAFLKG